jgi:hypothetical protein
MTTFSLVSSYFLHGAAWRVVQRGPFGEEAKTTVVMPFWLDEEMSADDLKEHTELKQSSAEPSWEQNIDIGFLSIYSTLLHLPPHRFHCVGDAGGILVCCDIGMRVRCSNQSARSYSLGKVGDHCLMTPRSFMEWSRCRMLQGVNVFVFEFKYFR